MHPILTSLNHQALPPTSSSIPTSSSSTIQPIVNYDIRSRNTPTEAFLHAARDAVRSLLDVLASLEKHEEETPIWADGELTVEAKTPGTLRFGSTVGREVSEDLSNMGGDRSVSGWIIPLFEKRIRSFPLPPPRKR